MYKSNGVMALNWYAYIGGDIFNAGSYMKLPGGEIGGNPESCVSGCTICAILLDQNTIYPSSISEVWYLFPAALANKQSQMDENNKIRVRMKDC